MASKISLINLSDDERLKRLHRYKELISRRGVGKSTREKQSTAKRDISEFMRHMGRSPVDKYRANMVKQESWLDQAQFALGHEVKKLGAGLGDFRDFLDDAGGNKEAMQRTINRRKEQENLDRVYKTFDEEADLSAKIMGSSIPYLATGHLLGPTTGRVGASLIDLAGRTGGAVAKSTGGVISKGIENLAARPGITGKLGAEAREMFVDPLVKRAARKAKQVKMISPYREGALKDVVGGTGLGALEGGAHYDYSPAEGAIAGGVGSAIGRVVGPYLQRSPDFYGENERRVIEWFKNQGGKTSPGLETGSRGNQMFEAGLRTSHDWADLMGEWDRGNNVIKNRIAFKAAGIPEGEIDQLTPEILRAHRSALKSDYEALEATTVGRILPEESHEIGLMIEELKKNTTPRGRKTLKVISAYRNDLRKILKITRSSRNNKITGAEFSGKDYKNIRRSIKSEMDMAFNKKDMDRYNSLANIRNVLDGSIERGVKDRSGTTGLNAWKDLNERFAMTNILVDHGTTTLGKFDPKRMRGYLRNDMTRLLSEEGGRIQDFHSLVKLDDIEKMQSGSTLTGHGLYDYRNPGKRSLAQKVMSTPAAAMLGPIPEIYMRSYLSGYPAVTGLMNLSGQGLGKPGLYTRALAQGSNVHPDITNAAVNAGINIKDMFGRASGYVRGLGQEE